MIKENGDVSVTNKRNYTEEEINIAYKKSRDEGGVGGVPTYQKRLIENLQRDSASLNRKLQEIKK